MKKIILLMQTGLQKLPRRCGLCFLLLITSSALQAQDVIGGKVTDETGAGLTGVNLLLKSTTTGVIVDASGQYALSVPDGDHVLVFPYRAVSNSPYFSCYIIN